MTVRIVCPEWSAEYDEDESVLGNKLTAELKSLLTSAQQEKFRSRVKSLNLDGIRTVSDGGSFGVVYSKVGPKKSQYQPVDRRTISALLTTADDVL